MYKSQGRKSFETKADQNIQGISLKSCQPSQASLKVDDQSLLAINIFGMKLYTSQNLQDGSNTWTIQDLQNNSCEFVSSSSLAEPNQALFLKSFHELTDLRRAQDLDQSLFY